MLAVAVTGSAHAVGVAAQRPSTTILGAVVDSGTLRPVEQVAVYVDGRTLVDQSDTTGSFQLDDLGSGPHILLLLKNGYSPRLFRFVIPNNHEGDVSVGNILLQPEPVATANIIGTVTDAITEEPLFGVAVSVNGVTVASTDLNGVFSIEAMDVQWGANLLRVRRFGYEPMEEELWIIQPRAEFDVLVELSPLAIELPTVVVEGERTVYDYAVVPGFERRRLTSLLRI